MKYVNNRTTGHQIVFKLLLCCMLAGPPLLLTAQVVDANHSGFAWITTESVNDQHYGAGYSIYSAAWPIFRDYPGPSDFQMGLAGCWLTTQRTGTEPEDFYTTIEGGLGWWHDTRFGTRVPKFIMGGVSHNFFAWANGPGAGRSNMLGNGQRDWSTPGGKYGVAQLSNTLLWAPDGLNMAQGLNGELLGYGYTPLPITKPLEQTQGQQIRTGNQCWTLFLNTTNFKGPATFFLPTFWTEPVLKDPSLEGLFLDSRPSDPNITFGIEHAVSPALTARDAHGNRYAKIQPFQFPANNGEHSMVLNEVSVYSHDALWDVMTDWFSGGGAVLPARIQSGSFGVPFVENGGAMVAELNSDGIRSPIRLDYIDNTQFSTNIMGFEFNHNMVKEGDGTFTMPEYFKLSEQDVWQQVDETQVPSSTQLTNAMVPKSQRPDVPYLTPLDPECHWQDPNGPWRSPGPAAGPFKTDLGDGSTLTYYWYRFVDQPAIIHADYPEEVREAMQARVELIHTNWSATDDYFAPPRIGHLATLDPGVIVRPPPGLEIGYVPIVTRQEKTEKKVRVIILAGQSNMEGYGKIDYPENQTGTLVDVLQNDSTGRWSVLGEVDNWNQLDDAYLYFERNGNIIKDNITVGQGAADDLIGPELMLAHQLDAYFDDPVLLIKTAYGGKSLAVDFRPPSAGGETGASYTQMIQTIKQVTQNLESEFPDIEAANYELTAFAWFQGWNDGASDLYLNEYESNLHHLIQDIRRDLDVPELPFVVASSGHGGFTTSDDQWVRSLQDIVSVAQEAVGCNDSLYGGHVGFVDSKPFYQSASASPVSSIHHFNENAWTYLNLGKSLGDEIILTINEMAYCYRECNQQVAPGTVSIGNRVWHDIDQDGINDPDEPGIPGVSLVLWGDSDGDDIPDWQGFGGVEITDENGYYRFGGLNPGNYLVFVWSVDNWAEGQPLHGWQSTTGYVSNANNDIDFDNNGFGEPFTDIKSGIVMLTTEGEPLLDGDPFNCYFDYDRSGNNTIDFGFFNPNITSSGTAITNSSIKMFPNPTKDVLNIISERPIYELQLFDMMGRRLVQVNPQNQSYPLNLKFLSPGLYTLRILNERREVIGVRKIIKEGKD